MSRRTARLPALLGAVVAVVVTAGPAGAHVSVTPAEAVRGSTARLTFRVPNESDTAGTVGIELVFPDAVTLTSVRLKPKSPWTGRVERDGRVTRVRWTGGRIGPGEFDEFDLTAGPLPETGDRLVIRVLQTYSDGSVVRWIDEPTAGHGEEGKPAPVLRLVAGGSAATDHGSVETTGPSATPTSAAPRENAPAAAAPDDVTTARRLGLAGLLAGALGLLAGAAALATRRRGAG